MKLTYYVPIYSWGENPNSEDGGTSACHMYSSLNDLYGFEGEDIVGYYEVEGNFPTQNEFQESIGMILCGAV